MAASNGYRIEDIESVLNGKQQVINTEPPRRKTIASKVAQNVSKRVTAAAQAEVIREAMGKFITTVYEHEHAIFWNVGKDGRIEIPVPWSRKGAARWGVRRTHAKILSHSMMKVQNKRTPFLFDQFDRRWYLDFENYPTVEDGLNWLDTFGIDAHMWTMMIESWKQSKR